MQDEFENEIKAKGLTAPRVTPADLEAAIASECYFVAADAFRFAWLTEDHADSDVRERCRSIIDGMGTSSYSSTCMNVDANTSIPQPLKHITICVLILKNGHKIVGVNEGPVSPENFDAEMGRRVARQKATQQLWQLLGYSLKERLFKEAGITDADRLNFIIADGQYPMNATFLGQPGANGETALFPGADAVRANLDNAIKLSKEAA